MVKPKPIVAHSYSRFPVLHVITLTGFSVSCVTGQRDYIGFGFATLN